MINTDMIVSGWSTIMQQEAFTAHTGIGSSMWGRIQHLVAAKLCSRENEGQQTQSQSAFLKKVIDGGEV
jgi:hypothetical protein